MLPISEQYLSSPCEVKSMDNVPILTGFITGISDEGVQISDKNEVLPIIHCNTTVKISVLNSALGFRVMIGKVYLSTREFTRIVDVQNASEYEKRNFFRVRLSIRSTAYLLNDEAPVDEPVQPFPVHIRDLSLSGLFFVSDKSLPAGSRIVVNLNVFDTRLSLLCKIVRSIPVELGTADGYGCEFLDNTGRQFDLLCKYLFDCQREQIRMLRQMRADAQEKLPEAEPPKKRKKNKKIK